VTYHFFRDLLEEPLHPIPSVTSSDKDALALAFARDWDDTACNVVEIQAKIAACVLNLLLLCNVHAQFLFRISEKETDSIELGLLHTYYRQLLPQTHLLCIDSRFLTKMLLSFWQRHS